jgi:hypothetical protein
MVNNPSKAAYLILGSSEALENTATASKGSAAANTVPTSHNLRYAVSKPVAADSKALNKNCSKTNDGNTSTANACETAPAFNAGALASRRATTCTVATAMTSVAIPTQKSAKQAVARSKDKQFTMDAVAVPDTSAKAANNNENCTVVNASNSVRARGQGGADSNDIRHDVKAYTIDEGKCLLTCQQQQQQQQWLTQYSKCNHGEKLPQQQHPVFEQLANSLRPASPYTHDSRYNCKIKAQQQQQQQQQQHNIDNGCGNIINTRNGMIYYSPFPAVQMQQQSPPSQMQQQLPQQLQRQDQHHFHSGSGSGNAAFTRNGTTYYSMPPAVEMQHQPFQPPLQQQQRRQDQHNIDSGSGIAATTRDGLTYSTLPSAVQMQQQQQQQQHSIDSGIGVIIWNGMAYYPLPTPVQGQPLMVAYNVSNVPINMQFILPLAHVPPSL